MASNDRCPCSTPLELKSQLETRSRKTMVGQNGISAPYMTVCMVISLPKTPYIHRIYMVLANPKKDHCWLRQMPLLHLAGAQVAAGDQKQKDHCWLRQKTLLHPAGAQVAAGDQKQKTLM